MEKKKKLNRNFYKRSLVFSIPKREKTKKRTKIPKREKTIKYLSFFKKKKTNRLKSRNKIVFPSSKVKEKRKRGCKLCPFILCLIFDKGAHKTLKIDKKKNAF